MCLTDEHLEGYMRIAARQIKSDIGSLIKQTLYQIYHKKLILIKTVIEYVNLIAIEGLS
jgi:hypothetical protein